MTDFLKGLLSKREFYTKQIAQIDQLIQEEISNLMQKTEAISNDNTSMIGEADDKNAYPQNGTYRSKIIYLLGEAKKSGRNGLRTKQIIDELKRRHKGEWENPAISQQLYHMKEADLIEVKKGLKADGGNLYYIK